MLVEKKMNTPIVEEFASKQMYVTNVVKQIKLMCGYSHVHLTKNLLVTSQEARRRPHCVHCVLHSTVRAEPWGSTSMGRMRVPLTTRRMHWLSRRWHHTHGN